MSDQRVRRFGLVCATAALGVLFNAGAIQVRNELAPAGYPHFAQLQAYAGAGSVLLALLVLHWFPSRGWAFLLLAGSVLGVPLPLIVTDPGLLGGLPQDLVTIAIVASTGLVLLGVLGAAGSTPSGGALAGTAIALPALGMMVIPLAWFVRPAVDLGWLLLTFGVLGLLGGIGAVLVAGRTQQPRPPELLTVCGVLAAILTVLPLWIRPEGPETGPGFLITGLAMLVPGLVIAGIAGRRILLGAVAVGLVGAALLASGAIVTEALGLHLEVLVPAIFAGIALGALATITRWPAWFGAAGLAACGIVALATGDLGLRHAGPVWLAAGLLAVGVGAVVAAIASAVPVLPEPAAIPATFGALAAVAQTGIGYVATYSAFRTGDDFGASAVSLAAVLLLLAAAAVLGVTLWNRRLAPPADEPAAEREPVVVHRLPDG